MIRKSVCAIVYRKDMYLLVERVMRLSHNNTLTKLDKPEWDLVKGGIDGSETPEQAVMRELEEETGSRRYRLARCFDDELRYDYPPEIARDTGFSGQITKVFLVEYTGNGTDLSTKDGENSRLEFLPRQDALKRLKYPETRAYFESHVPR